MLIQILRGTPLWVLVLFFVLLAIGSAASRPRHVGRSGVLLLPAALSAFSVYGALGTFGLTATAGIPWIAGLCFAIYLGAALGRLRDASFDPATQRFAIPGSWIPLLLMMAVFFTKYLVGVISARQLPLGRSEWFVIAISFAYGAFSGLFVARAWVVWRRRRGI